MKEIAEAAGVSISTVSLVLNGRDEGRVKAPLAALVREKADELGYTVNPLARSLRTCRTRILGFISEEVATTPYAGGIILGAQDAASTYGYMIITVSTDGRASEENEIATLKRYGVDGFFYSKMSNRIASVPASLGDYPVVMVDATDADNQIPSIEPDEFQIAYDPSLVCNVLNNGPALRAVDKLFDERNPDGFFCFNDARAWYVYECAARRGLTVGKDVSIVGVDNHRVLAETLEPQLTTVELPHYEMGYWAACKLISMIERKPVDSSSWPNTTAPMPPLDSPIPAKIHCALIEKGSVRS